MSLKLFRNLLLVAITFVYAGLSQAAVFTCERSEFKRSGKTVFSAYAKLVMEPQITGSVVFATSRDEAHLDDLLSDRWSLQLLQYTDKIKGFLAYSNRELAEVKASAGSIQILNVPASLFQNFSENLRILPTTVTLEDRDYDDDYTSAFFKKNGYELRGTAKYECFLTDN